MKKGQRKPSLKKNNAKKKKEKVPVLTNIDRMFTLYCDGKAISAIAKEFGYDRRTLNSYALKENWEERRAEIHRRVKNDLSEQIKIEKTNQAIVGLMIKRTNTRRMLKEYEAYQEKGRLPSFVGTNPKEYLENLHLAEILMEGDKKKIDVNVKGKMKHDVRNFTPEQMDRIFDVLCDYKGIPRSPLEEEDNE